MRSICSAALVLASISSVAFGQAPARGPLRVHAENPRYFADDRGQAVYLTGSHMWNNLVDMGRSRPPEPLDFKAYLDFLEQRHHNFIRLWAWDSSTWDTRANRGLGKDFIHQVAPLPWARTTSGPLLRTGSGASGAGGWRSTRSTWRSTNRAP